MTPPADRSTNTPPGAWRRVPADLPAPVVATAPYVELAVAHPDLPATRMAGSFWPAAVPYRLDGAERVFYWRNDLSDAATRGENAHGKTARDDGVTGDGVAGWCATPDALHPLIDGAPARLRLATPTDGGHEVAVDATVAGESTTAVVGGYTPPTVEIRDVTPDAVEIAVDATHATGASITVPAGERVDVDLAPQTVTVLESPAAEVRDGGIADDGNGANETANDGTVDGHDEVVETTPVLQVRYPGDRRVYHPSPSGDALLFPSFGIDLEASGRVPIDPDDVDLDLDAVADALGASLAARPYPERVLWEAFAYAAFDPGRDGVVALSQFADGLLAVQDPPASMR